MRIAPFLAAALLAVAPPALAAADSAEANVDNDRFVIGGSVRHSHPVEGDLVGIGGNVDLAAIVGGDAVVTGGDVRVREPIGHNLYAAGGNVKVEAPVGGNARMAGGNVELTSTGAIGGNLSTAGGTIEIRGPVSGHVRAAGGNVFIDSVIGGDLKIAAGDLELGPNARIGGRLVHSGHTKIRRDPAAQVAGGVERGSPRRDRDSLRGARFDFGWAWELGLVALAALIAGAFPAASRSMGEQLRGEPGMALLLGFITLICVPVAAILLAITLIGIPLALGLLLLYLVMLLVGYAALAVVIGDTALARLRSQDATRAGWRMGAAALAMLALAVLAHIPVLGGVIVFVALLAGIGAIVLAVRSRTTPAAAA